MRSLISYPRLRGFCLNWLSRFLASVGLARIKTVEKQGQGLVGLRGAWLKFNQRESLSQEATKINTMTFTGRVDGRWIESSQIPLFSINNMSHNAIWNFLLCSLLAFCRRTNRLIYGRRNSSKRRVIRKDIKGW